MFWQKNWQKLSTTVIDVSAVGAVTLSKEYLLIHIYRSMLIEMIRESFWKTENKNIDIIYKKWTKSYFGLFLSFGDGFGSISSNGAKNIMCA